MKISKEAREAYQSYLDWFTAKPDTDAYSGLEQAFQSLINATLVKAAGVAGGMAMVLPVEDCCVLHGECVAAAIMALKEDGE